MANIRGLKKDINYVASELIIEGLTYNYIFPDKNLDGLAEIISEALSMREDLLKKVNALRGTKETEAKMQFKSIRKEFQEKTENFVERLEKFEKE